MSKILKELGLNDIDIDALNNALTAYSNEFKKTIDDLEKDGKRTLLGRRQGENIVWDLRIKLGLSKPEPKTTITLYVEEIE